MPKKSDDRRVTADASVVLDNGGAASRDRLAQLSLTVMPVHSPAHAIAGLAKRSLGAMRDGCPIENQRRQIRIHVSPKVSPDESGLKDSEQRTHNDKAAVKVT